MYFLTRVNIQCQVYFLIAQWRFRQTWCVNDLCPLWVSTAQFWTREILGQRAFSWNYRSLSLLQYLRQVEWEGGHP